MHLWGGKVALVEATRGLLLKKDGAVLVVLSAGATSRAESV